MGGLIFILSTIIVLAILLITKKITYTSNLTIVLFVFLSYALLGFIDDYRIIKYKSNEKGLTRLQKFIGQVIIAVGFFLLYVKNGIKIVRSDTFCGEYRTVWHVDGDAVAFSHLTFTE